MSKTYLGHKNPKMEDGKSLVDWITETVKDECQFYNVPIPTPKQMAVVISAIRMHTIIMRAASYDHSDLYPYQDRKTEFWPTESSIGRFFRDAARVTLEDES